MSFVYKKTNELEIFSREKILTSLCHLGFNYSEAVEIFEKLKDQLEQAKTTQQIFNVILDYLKKNHPVLATKYNLKKGLERFGPSGFPFEKYFARLLSSYNFRVQTNVFLKGKCVDHEIDVLAERDNDLFLIECKFHHLGFLKTGIKDVLTLWGRYLDIKEANLDFKGKNFYPWIVTNTKISLEALDFCQCRHIKVTSWNWPLNENLPQLIEHYALWPIGILINLSNEKLKLLLNNGVILVSDLFDIPQAKLKNILKDDYFSIMEEAQRLFKLKETK